MLRRFARSQPVVSTPTPHSSRACARLHRMGAAKSTMRQDGQQHQQQQDALGVVIVDHGSRRKASNDMLLDFCQLYQQNTRQAVVEPAHMEIAEPTIAQAIGRCAERGAKHVVVAPYFLSRGRHIQEDIPALVAAAQKQYPQLQCSIAEPIGIDPLMVQLISNRVKAVLADDSRLAAAPAEQSHGTAQLEAVQPTGS
eukprot:GHRR01006142.1.p2 GENE.GHRR01006142.1~~GHRR01006142.1.p2  ORF type:complete len:197 (+),score=41.23 GHRR01006142.1:495-1085(+)